MDYEINEWLEVKSDVMGGKPVIKGTRLDVGTVVGHLLAGDSVDEVLEAFPFVTKQDIEACRDFANKMANRHYSVVEFKRAQ